MNFFKSVFADDPDPIDHQKIQRSASESPKKTSEEEDPVQELPLEEIDSNPNPSPKSSSGGSSWSFGGLIKTISSKSESVIQIYRRDLEEFGSGLKKETAAIREAANRAVKELPLSIEVGASVAQGSIESVGHVIDDFGNSVWRGTTEIISQSKDALLSSDLESDSSDSQQVRNSKRYNRFESQVHAIQTDLSTYCEEPNDLDEFVKWKLGFELEEKIEEIEDLLGENGVMEGMFAKFVPSVVDHETFWCRYFYRIHKLKQVEDARANLVKRAIAGEDNEDLSWDVDDDENNVSKSRGDSHEIEELGKKETSASSEVVEREINDKGSVVELVCDNANTENVLPLEGKSDEKMLVEGKTEAGESSKDSDISVVSSQPLSAEEEDLGWDEIEDLDSNDEKKMNVGGSPNLTDLRKRLSVADEEDDLNWDIEDDDEPVKP